MISCGASHRYNIAYMQCHPQQDALAWPWITSIKGAGDQRLWGASFDGVLPRAKVYLADHPAEDNIAGKQFCSCDLHHMIPC